MFWSSPFNLHCFWDTVRAGFDQAATENSRIRIDILSNPLNYSTLMNGVCTGRPLSGAEIINWIKKNAVRITNGKDYSKSKRLGIGFSRFDADIEAEYKSYKIFEPEPVSYELFANICGPYWDADIKSDIRVNMRDLGEKLVRAWTIMAALKSAVGGLRREFNIETDAVSAEHEQIKEETSNMRYEIVLNSPNYSPTVVGGEAYGRPLSGAEIISWVKRTGKRITNGKDYSKTRRIGIGFSYYDVNIKAEYEKYKNTEPDPVSYELFANICGPYWEADVKDGNRAYIQGEVDEFLHKFLQNVTIMVSLQNVMQYIDFSGVSIEMPMLSQRSFVSEFGVHAVHWREGAFGITGVSLTGLSAAQLEHVIYAVFGSGDGGGNGGTGGYAGGGEGRDGGSEGSGSAPKPGSLNNVETRRWYLEQEAKIPQIIDKTKPLEHQAKQAFDFRNQIRTQARDAMSDRALAEKLFGTRPNMTWEQIVEKYTSRGFSGDRLYQEIIEASQRSNAAVNEALNVFPK